MASHTKMIIITSNEDIIRQFSLNKTTNTHIIDLENDKQGTSIAKDNDNIINLSFFAELAKLNSSNDQVYKRALDSPHDNQSKPVKIQKKSIDLICTICGDQAIGFNYNVLSCASCKAFFRRNANQPSGKLRCSSGQGQCSVAHEMRRKCPRCRLDRCFAMGMRKDFIISEEEKQKKRKHLEENRIMTSTRLSTSESTNLSSISQPVSTSESVSQTLNEIDHVLMNMDEDDENIVFHESANSNQLNDTVLETLSVEDWATIQSVRSSFLSSFSNDTTNSTSIDVSDRISALISWSQSADQTALRFISFFRQIDEFENLHADDRFILVKYNLFLLFPLFKCFNYNPINGCFSHVENEEVENHHRFYLLCFGSDGVRKTFINLILSLVEVTEQDPIILSLLLIILMFCQGLSMNEDEPLLKDSLAVNRVQSYYTKLLWTYMVIKWDEVQACRRFAQLVTEIFRMQSATKTFREFFRDEFMTSNSVDRIAPLMQSFLHIS